LRTLKAMAEGGYVMGLSTIGEVANHMRSHHYAYFLMDKTWGQQMQEFDEMVAGHEDDSIDLYLSDEKKREIDAEMEKMMGENQ